MLTADCHAIQISINAMNALEQSGSCKGAYADRGYRCACIIAGNEMNSGAFLSFVFFAL